MFNNFLKLIKIPISLCTFLAIFYTILELTYFISVPKTEFKKEAGDLQLHTTRAMLTNMALLSLFIIQHSTMASQKFKNCINNLNLQDMSRSIYVTGTSATLWLIIKYWQTVNTVLWKIDLSFMPLLWLYFGIHCTAWIIIYVATICTDVTELLGLKQIYYRLFNLPDPNIRKSNQLRELNKHMRHPSFLGFLFILWLFPLMTLDRFLLATILSSYMYIAWNTDGEDYNYQKYMYQKKYLELERFQS